MLPRCEVTDVSRASGAERPLTLRGSVIESRMRAFLAGGEVNRFLS